MYPFHAEYHHQREDGHDDHDQRHGPISTAAPGHDIKEGKTSPSEPETRGIAPMRSSITYYEKTLICCKFL